MPDGVPLNAVELQSAIVQKIQPFSSVNTRWITSGIHTRWLIFTQNSDLIDSIENQ
jgi:hypothetical protein